MDTIKNYQLDKFNELNESINDLLNNIEKINDMDKESKFNIIDKLRILNKDIDGLKNNINTILVDIKNKSSTMDLQTITKIKEYEKIDKTIYELSPLILYYQLIKS